MLMLFVGLPNSAVCRRRNAMTPIVHTTDYKAMLERSLETETKAAEVYAGIIAA